MSMTILTVKRIDPSLPRLEWERIALELFKGVYMGQMSRIMNAIQRADPATVAAMLSEAFYLEPTLIETATRKFYDDMAYSGGQDALDDFDLTADHDEIRDSLTALSRARGGWFAKAMTETSIEQTHEKVSKWLDTEGGTVADLREEVAKVWTGPRPAAAATTETTFMFSESRFVSWEASGVWGYGVNTMNDDRVRDTHKDAAKNGPYPLSDRDHRPPVYGDVNCRCTAYPVREAPNG